MPQRTPQEREAYAGVRSIELRLGHNARFADGVAVFTMDEAGLMYEASIGGQKFSYQARQGSVARE